MRVICGTAKGHRLETVESLTARPTTDRIKETLFNIINFDLPDCSFLDLFSGSGAIGIEALSRGALKAVFVELEANCSSIIEKNLRHTKLFEKAEIISLDALQAIKRIAEKNQAFDIIFMDPPYNNELILPVLEAILKGKLLKTNGYIIVERSSKSEPPNACGYKIIKEKNYKTTIITFLSLEEAFSC